MQATEEQTHNKVISPQTAAFWLKIEDIATQIRILSLQARVGAEITTQRVQESYELTQNMQEQLRSLLLDANIPVRDPNIPTRKRKRQNEGELRTCKTCLTTDTPEWRRGPTGPGTLCNACGLKWAKKRRAEKRKEKHENSALPSLQFQQDENVFFSMDAPRSFKPSEENPTAGAVTNIFDSNQPNSETNDISFPKINTGRGDQFSLPSLFVCSKTRA